MQAPPLQGVCRGSGGSTTAGSWAWQRRGLEKQAPWDMEACRCLPENSSRFSGKLLRPSRILQHRLRRSELIAMRRPTEIMPIKYRKREQNLALLVHLESDLPTAVAFSGIKYWENAGWVGHVSFRGHCGRKRLSWLLVHFSHPL